MDTRAVESQRQNGSSPQLLARLSYWRVFLMCLIASLLAGDIDLNFNLVNTQINYQTTVEQASRLVGVLALVVVLVASLCWGILFSPVIRVGQCRYLIQNRAGEVGLGTLFSGFSNNYWNTVSGIFYANLRIFLFTLLLVIPGIIKAYQYTFVPYLLAENPDMEPARAAEISTLMTDGEKWNIFVLDLSFLGWRLLGLLLFGIGLIFVTPYVQTTEAELYAALRAKVIAGGYVSEEELAGQS